MSTIESQTPTDVKKPAPAPKPGSDQVDHKAAPEAHPLAGQDLSHAKLNDVKALNPDKPAGQTEAQALKTGSLEIPPIDKVAPAAPHADGTPKTPAEVAAAAKADATKGDKSTGFFSGMVNSLENGVVTAAKDIGNAAYDAAAALAPAKPEAAAVATNTDGTPKTPAEIAAAPKDATKPVDPTKPLDATKPADPPASTGFLSGLTNTIGSDLSSAAKAVGNVAYNVASDVIGKENVDSFLNSGVVKDVESLASSSYDYGANLLNNTSFTDGLITKSVGANGVEQMEIKNTQLADNALTAATDAVQFGGGKAGDANAAMNNDMFNKIRDSVGAKGGVANPTDATTLAMEADKKALIGTHKPGDSWTDPKNDNAAMSLDAKGNLLVVKGKGDTTWYGPNGQSYQDKNGVETWRKNGQELTSDGKNNYSFTDSNGNKTTLNKDQKEIVHTVQGLEIRQHNEIRDKLTADAKDKLPDGAGVWGNATSYGMHDGNGNHFVKDSLSKGEDISTPGANGQPPKHYHVENGQVFEEGSKTPITDQKTIESLGLKSDGKGGFNFGTVHIDHADNIVDSNHDVHLNDKTNGFNAENNTVKATADNGKSTLDVQGQFHAESVVNPATNTSTYKQTGPNGEPQLDYNFNTGTMRGDGITFTSEGSHISGTDFAVSNSGVVESDQQWNTDNLNNGITDAPDYNSSNYSGDGSSGDGSQSGSLDPSQLGPDGTPLTAEQIAGRDEDRLDDQIQNDFDRNARKTERREQKERDEAEARARKEDNPDDIVAQHRKDLLSGNLLKLPKEWQQHLLLNNVDKGAGLAALARGDESSIGVIDDIKSQVASAGAKIGTDLGITSWLGAREARIASNVDQKHLLEEFGGSPTPDMMRRLKERGGGLLAAASIIQEDQRASA